jgi:hypothetical protein
MEFQFAYIIGIVAIGAFLIRIFLSILQPSNPGGALNKKFVALGSLTGKTKAEIVARVGQISAQTVNPDNSFTCTWAAGNYAITVQFDTNQRAQKIIHEKLQ